MATGDTPTSTTSPQLHDIFIGAAMRSIPFILVCGLLSIANQWVVGDEISLVDQYRTADAVYVAKLASSRKPDQEKQIRGRSSFEIIKILRESKEMFKVGETFDLRYFIEEDIGTSFLWFQQSEEKFDRNWRNLARIDQSDLGYLTEAPLEQAQDADRLAYYLKFLSHSNSDIANDAILELGYINFSVISAHKETLNPDILRQCIRNHQTGFLEPYSLYLVMLGLCGNEDDAKMFEAEIIRTFRVGEEFRFVSGFMMGYLLLRHEPGLKFLEEHKLHKQERFGERYAVMLALRFMWRFGEDRISKARLLQSMRIYLDMPEFADLAIIDLLRWEDWSSSDRIVELYGKPEFDNPNIKRAIIRFFLTAEATKPKGANPPLPAHVVTAQKHLKSLREKDPEMVKISEEFFSVMSEQNEK